MQIKLLIKLKNLIKALKSIKTTVKSSIIEPPVEIKQEQTIPDKIYYNNDIERKVITSFIEMQNSSEFKSKFLNLIKNLDETSISIVTTALNRQLKVFQTQGNVDIYTLEEQNELRKMWDDFSNNILKITNALYSYRGYFLPINRFDPSVFYHKHGLKMVENFEYFANKNIIDAGAFIGDSALILSPLTNKQVYSFEGITENFELLKNTIELNNAKNIVPLKVALGATSGNLEFYVGDSCSSFHKPARECHGKEIVPVISLDEFVQKENIEVGLIKVDIEGFEQEFLKGAQNTIKIQKPTLLLSIYHNVDDFFNIKPIIESWDLGYKFKIYKPLDYSISLEMLLIAEI